MAYARCRAVLATIESIRENVIEEQETPAHPKVPTNGFSNGYIGTKLLSGPLHPLVRMEMHRQRVAEQEAAAKAQSPPLTATSSSLLAAII